MRCFFSVRVVSSSIVIAFNAFRFVGFDDDFVDVLLNYVCVNYCKYVM